MKRKICVITATRAEYGLLSNVIRLIDQHDQLQLQLIATGTHLSPEYGYTLDEILADGIKVDKKIEIVLSSDTAVGASKAMGLAQISFAEAFAELEPDLIVILGDRYELLPIVNTAQVMRIPVAHLNGGEITEGAIDDSIRHAVTKLSHLHFTATEAYRQRVIQLGEQPERVFNIGEVGLDNIKRLDLMSKAEFEQSIDFRLDIKSVLITYHPETLGDAKPTQQFQEILNALDSLQNTSLIFTHANADVAGREINEMIEHYVAPNRHKAVSFPSLGYKRYLSALQYVDAVVGNSSSGIVETASFQRATVNIGDRQKGRICAENVLHCPCEQSAISTNLAVALSEEFKKKIAEIENPYGKGDSSQKLIKLITEIDLKALTHKVFYDL